MSQNDEVKNNPQPKTEFPVFAIDPDDPAQWPDNKRGNKRQSKYPFAQMKVDECFEVDGTFKAISSIAYSYGRTHKMQFSVRTVGDKLRVRRVK